jgi:hypothetical protein
MRSGAWMLDTFMRIAPMQSLLDRRRACTRKEICCLPAGVQARRVPGRMLAGPKNSIRPTGGPRGGRQSPIELACLRQSLTPAVLPSQTSQPSGPRQPRPCRSSSLCDYTCGNRHRRATSSLLQAFSPPSLKTCPSEGILLLLLFCYFWCFLVHTLSISIFCYSPTLHLCDFHV